ncbi:uncharacterized protein PV09_09017 [Verruconis gallopava]|uniref:Serine hydrolase domain-containing protein n=1 Tax=Verruconis gallopava TaxID=253628 RepID=A0A0D1XAL0_9PEZI|nr:uncharacterized protein PV09_09017 [Verruconis gallopava]KIV99245.1 hypothetical protein PV09_09017 [Verruconis gallopava]
MMNRKILVLHGVAQSGPVFLNRRINTIVHTLEPFGFEFIALTGLFEISNTPYVNARQHDYRTGDDERSWWETDDILRKHTGIEATMALWGETLNKHGPFAGVLGFSQGGCAAASIAAMLEPSRRCHPLVKKYVPPWHPPLEFLIMFSGNPYRYPDETVHWLFYAEGGPENVINTPALAFYGEKEWESEKSQRERQQWLISRLANAKVVSHPWKHTVPRTQKFADIVKDFVLQITKESSKVDHRL